MASRDDIRAAGRVLLGSLFPPRCLGCLGHMPFQPALDRSLGSPDGPDTEDARWFCLACLAALVHIERPRCASCALPLTPFLDTPSSAWALTCPECAAASPAWGCARAPFAYEGPVQAAIRRLKFDGDRGAAEGLGALMSGWIVGGDPPTTAPRSPVVVPVPSSASRVRLRGYTPAALLAGEVARRSGWRCEVDGLLRPGDEGAAPQRSLSRAERLGNLQGAFVADQRRVGGARVVLIDDVLTTGATAIEATRALSEVGARVWLVLVAARSS